jgi:hypothetical protein
LGYNFLPAAAAFNYPDEVNDDEDGGRVFLTGGHPENEVWFCGHIENAGGSGDHNLVWGLYKWCDDNGKTLDTDKYQVNEWFMRRETAWAAGLDETKLPTKEQSQIAYIENDEPEFTITGCVALPNSDDYDLNLSLYYQYNESVDGTNFTNWTRYDSIYDAPYQFTFNANNANGNGTYRLCTLLNYSYESGKTSGTVYYQQEFPSAPYSLIYVGNQIVANFSCSSSKPYDIHNVTFNDTSSTYLDTYITNYSWDFGDGNISYEQNATHKYSDNGVYIVWHNVTNNVNETGSISRDITVRNVPPEADFLPTSVVVKVDETVNFIENATDVDGSIVYCYWDFGDNSTASGFDVNHSYSTSGYYTVSLKVTDDDGITDAINNSICTDWRYRSDCVLVIDGIVNGNLGEDDPENLTWTTIQKGIDNLSALDTLYIKSSYYSEDILVNKSLTLIGENENTVIINGSVTMIDTNDYELPNDGEFDWIYNMSMDGNVLLFHFNNDTDKGENYSTSNLVVDYSGQGYNGTNNGASWTTSTLKGAGAFDFDGINDSISLSSISALTGENVTVSAWIYWKGGSGTTDTILSQSNSTLGYCLYVNNTNSTPSFRLDDTKVVSSVNLTNGWHHIVGTHNKNSSLLKIYLDGKLYGTVYKAGSGIDSDAFVGFDNVSNYFNGTIDEVAVWNRTLSDDEIARMYNYNYGVIINTVTVQNSGATGLILCNNTEVENCVIVNHTRGISIDDLCNIFVQCNISYCDTGISIIDSNPDEYEPVSVDNCHIVNCINGLIVNSSSQASITYTYFNCSSINLRFNDCNFSTIDVIGNDAWGNVAPDTPSTVSGPAVGDPNILYNFSSKTNDSNNDQILYLFYWGEDENTTGWVESYWSNETVNASHKWADHGGYYVQVVAMDMFNGFSNGSEPLLFKTETLLPFINSVNNSSDTVGFGFDVIITANVTDDTSGNYSGIKTVKVNISYPDDTSGNFSMEDVGNNTFEYVFSDTWLVGQYNYSIWVVDNAYNANCSAGYCFNVSGQATVSVCTLKDSYGDNETVNLTDPPSNPPPLVGYELLDDGKVLHIWNRYDSYFFDTDNGVQLTNHYDEYWSHNVLMLGYYNNDVWNLIYRSDDLSGFNRDIDSDNETFVNATLWKDLTYKGYNFRLAIRYHLGVFDNELNVIPYIKNIDNKDIPYVLGFAWEINDIRVDMTTSGDYIEINGTRFDLNESLDLTFSNMTDPVYCWDNTTNETIVCDYVPIPFFYIREDMLDNRSESLYLRWNESLNYRVLVKSRDGEYNAPVTLAIRIGTLASGQEKHTNVFWHDASEVVYYFDGYDDIAQGGEAWAYDPGFMVDGNIPFFARTSVNDDVELCDNNTCSGSDLGAISKVEIRCFGYYYFLDSQADIILRPVFLGQDGYNHNFVTSIAGDWSSWFDITYDNNLPWSWDWDDVRDLDCDVEAEKDIYGPPSFMLFCSKVEVRVTYTANPVISAPYPADGSTGISIVPMLNITVYDEDGDLMNITWLSNSSGGWQVFGINSSVGNGTYHQTMVNASVNGLWWFWRVNVSDGNNYTLSDVFSFYTGCESKIKNTGSVDIYGYLLIQVQFWNTTLDEWVLVDEVVNETSARRINSSEQFGLDIVFNDIVSTSDLLDLFGVGTYRVYVAFIDFDNDVLVCDDESLMEDSYQFTVSAG